MSDIFEVKVEGVRYLAKVSDWFPVAVTPPKNEPGWYQIRFGYSTDMIRSRWWTGKRWKVACRGRESIFGNNPKDKWRGIELIEVIK